MAKILMIDDDVEFCASVAGLLQAKGHTVTTAGDSDLGYKKAKYEKPDLILLDVMMTTEDEGFVLAKKLKKEVSTSSIPVILLTGLRRAKGLPFSYEPDEDWLPVRAVIEKPVKPDILFKAIADSLTA